MRVRFSLPAPMQKILVIVGPTATGKSALAVKLAKKLARHKWGGFSGAEIISADSRQVYKGLNIGTGKITEKETRGVPHYLLDAANPKNRFTVINFQKLAREKIAEICSRGHLPIICGGTGFYIEAVTKNITLPDAPPNEKLRSALRNKTPETLLNMLMKLDPKRGRTIDQKNPRRIIRAIEIAKALGQVPMIKKSAIPYKIMQIGLTMPRKTLRKKIAERLHSRLSQGMIAEVKLLHKKGLSWKRMEELGLEYRYLSKHLKNEISKSKMIERLNIEICRYAKRQILWFKRDKSIKWFGPKNFSKIQTTVKNFLR